MEKTDNQKDSAKKPVRRKLKPINDYIKYSGLAFQMALLLLLGYWLGSKIDVWLDLRFPAFAISLLLLFLFMSIYALIKNLPKN